MIALLTGKIIETNLESAIVDVGGVGYEVLLNSRSLSDLQSMVDPSVTTKFHIYTHVREDALVLFGFLDSIEKQMFLSLLKVNGVGPKMALTILSGASPDEISQMIEGEDIKALSKLPKVGKKTAEQLILTLKGKLVLAPATDEATKGKKTEDRLMAGSKKQIYTALVNLGFRPTDVEKVVKEFSESTDIQEGVRQGLAALTNI